MNFCDKTILIYNIVLILYFFHFLKEHMVVFKVICLQVMDNSANNVGFINWQYISAFLKSFLNKMSSFCRDSGILWEENFIHIYSLIKYMYIFTFLYSSSKRISVNFSENVQDVNISDIYMCMLDIIYIYIKILKTHIYSTSTIFSMRYYFGRNYFFLKYHVLFKYFCLK